MSNPYQSPEGSQRQSNEKTSWRTLFHYFVWASWLLGVALIVGSWFDLVSATLGWMGFGLACCASLLSYAFPYLAGAAVEDYVILDSRLLTRRGPAYQDAMDRFKNGAYLMHDGATFCFRPNNEIACGVVADSTSDFDETSALELAGHAKHVFDKLVSQCAEFAGAVDGRDLRISVMSAIGPNASEICRIVDGNLEWRGRPAGP